jgi:NhaC family Na+:H+ antiporter
MTGSSWTTIATIGMALLGIGEALSVPNYWTAGAIISGAYFGDKISPLSDTTVLASSASGTDIFTHIRYMLYTTTPTMVITLIIFFIAGFWYGGGEDSNIMQYTEGLANTFNITLWTLIVPIITAVLIAKKVPSLITLFVSALTAGIVAIIAQRGILLEIAEAETENAMNITKGLLTTFFGSTSVETGSSTLNDLVSTGGMAGMLPTIWLILCAMCFGGVMVGSGMMGAITRTLLKGVKSVVGAVSSTVFSGIFFNCCTGDQFMSIILACDLNKGSFDRLGVDRRVLSRATEDSATVVSVLIPWNTCGVVQSMVLGVPTLAFAPFCFFNLISPLMSILVAKLNYRILRVGNEESSVAYISEKGNL